MLHGDPWSRWQIMKEATPSKKSSQVSSDMHWHTGAYYLIMYSVLLAKSRKVMCRCNRRISDLEENRRARDATGLGWFNDSNLQSGITSICQYLVGDKYMWHDRGRKLRTLQLKHIPDGQDQPRPTWLVLLRLQRWRSLGMFRTSEMSRVCFAKLNVNVCEHFNHWHCWNHLANSGSAENRGLTWTRPSRQNVLV